VRVIATAGHVDHGKSTLVWALTGTDPDRWEAEKSRGMTIDLGFASATLPSGREVGFVDVPGHCRFVKNMLAGVSTVDACLFVVDAGEGWMAQSEEHLRILELLGISRGLVALTKVATVDDEVRELAALEVADHVQHTFLAEAETVLVDVRADIGVDELRAALDRLVDITPAAADLHRPRMWVDRSFPIRGAGTVLTGTLTGGRLAVDDEVVIEPGAYRARVRGLQSHYRSLTAAEPGRRLAVNLAGVSHQKIARGHALVRPGQWHLTGTVDASLRVLDSVDRPVGRRGAFSVHLGSGDFPARLRILGSAASIEPGEERTVRLWLEGLVPLPLLPGDRYVLRELGRSETLGGGQILDVEPVLRPVKAAPSLSVQRVIDERGWVDAAHLERLTGERRSPTAGKWVIAPAVDSEIKAQILARCRQAAREGVNVAAFTEVQRAVLQTGVPGVTVQADHAFDESAIPTTLSDSASRVLAALERQPWTPPDLPLSERGALRELERRGMACQADELWFSAAAIEAAVEVLAKLVQASPDGFTVSEAREALGTTRKYVLPLLGHLDARGVTRRHGDRRVAGPTMPPPR
jgi:selenocysteine-specific elongation factor